MDDDAREPVGKVVRDAEIVLPGQVYWQDETFQSSREGLVAKTLGYILLRRYDLDIAGTDIYEGDEIVKFGLYQAELDRTFFIYRLRYRGHYPDMHGHTLIKAWFTDKAPVRRQ